MKEPKYVNPPDRLLLGPGPSLVPPRVMKALAAPSVGLMDPYLLKIFSEEQELLRQVFRTQNEWTFAVSGTGTSGMETILSNLIEPGDQVLCAVHGYFGERMADVAQRSGAKVDRLARPWGEIFTVEEIRSALERKTYKLLTLVHAETSTGALQMNIKEIAEAAHSQGTLLALDAVTSLAGMEVEIDGWNVDAAYSASQKCLSAPPGLAPLTLRPGALKVIQERKHPAPSFYLDLRSYASYWGTPHTYHHTACSNLHFALREALGLIVEEGMEGCFKRHRENSEILCLGLERLGFQLLVPREYRIPALITVRPPEGVNEADLRSHLLNSHGIEVGGGLGEWKGKVLRIGLMGHSSQPGNVDRLLNAISDFR